MGRTLENNQEFLPLVSISSTRSSLPTQYQKFPAEGNQEQTYKKTFGRYQGITGNGTAAFDLHESWQADGLGLLNSVVRPAYRLASRTFHHTACCHSMRSIYRLGKSLGRIVGQRVKTETSCESNVFDYERCISARAKTEKH